MPDRQPRPISEMLAAWLAKHHPEALDTLPTPTVDTLPTLAHFDDFEIECVFTTVCYECMEWPGQVGADPR